MRGINLYRTVDDSVGHSASPNEMCEVRVF
jgi:hypothetical protein